MFRIYLQIEGKPPSLWFRVLTNNDPIRKNEELNIWSEGAEHQAARHHHAAEDGHRASSKVVYTSTADGT